MRSGSKLCAKVKAVRDRPLGQRRTLVRHQEGTAHELHKPSADLDLHCVRVSHVTQALCLVE